MARNFGFSAGRSSEYSINPQLPHFDHLLTEQKAARLEQLLPILNVIGTEPAIFCGELYGALPWPGA